MALLAANPQPSKASVYFVSLGCPKNLVDSEVMLGTLEKDRYRITRNPSEAEVIIVNTCSFIQASKEESIETLLEMAQLKETARCKVLVASGCLPQRYARELEKEFPEVDLFIGTGQYQRISELLESRARALASGDSLPPRSYVDQPAFIHTEKDPRMHTGPAYSAYLKLSEGCNRRCAFCIIPKLRGNVRSRSEASLVEEAEGMALRGIRELNLVAQDLTEYGMEWKYRERLETLLPKLSRVAGIDWIRLHYVYPDEFSPELVALIATEPKIVKYLDMPIQHTSDRILKSMNRRLTKARLFELVSELRQKIPGIVFRTSIIVGFPGETEDDFQELCNDLEKLNLEHVGVFRYSKEEGTKAGEMGDQVHPATKRRRARTLIGILQQKSLENQKKYLGQRLPVLIEGLSRETDLLIQGRLSTQAREIDGHVLINDLALPGDDAEVAAGDLIEVEITEALPHDLMGTALRMISKSRIQKNEVMAYAHVE